MNIDFTNVPKSVFETVHIKASSIKPEPVSWLWQNWLPAGMLTILAGQAGTGKTTLAMSIASAVTNGGKLPDGGVCQKNGEVWVWTGEDSLPHTLVPRLKAAGADLDKVRLLTHAIDFSEGKEEKFAFDPARDIEKLAVDFEVYRHMDKSPILLIIDPISSAVLGDSHKNTEVRRSLQPLVDLAQASGCAVLGITHLTKGTQGRDPLERVTGSLAFGAIARAVWLTAKGSNDENDPKRVLTLAKSTCATDGGGIEYQIKQVKIENDIETSTCEFGQTLKGSAKSIIAGLENEEISTKQDNCEAWLTDLLSSGKMLKKDVLQVGDLDGFSKRTIERVASKICLFEREKKRGGGTLFRLKNLLAPNTSAWRDLNYEKTSPSIDKASSDVLLAPSGNSVRGVGVSKNVKVEV